MTWDLRIDLETGDWLFDGKRDLQDVSGDALVLQRIHTRLKIRRGSFAYDRSGKLGSHIINLIRAGVPSARENLEQMVRDALDPMEDIQVTEISITLPEDRGGTAPTMVQVRIRYMILNANLGLLSNQIVGGDNETTLSIPI